MTKVCTFGKIYKLFVELNKSNTESYRSGHNGPDSKSGSPHGLVGSNPTRSAIEKSSNHAGLLDFSFFVVYPKITRFWAVLSIILERTAFCFISRFFLRFAPICCRNRPLREGAYRTPSPALKRVSNCNPDGRRYSPWWKNPNVPASPESA